MFDKFTNVYQASGYVEWQQIYLLVGELVDTAKDIIEGDALPYFVGEFSARALKVLADPLHFLYGEINEFLNKGPPWQVVRLPSYWTDRILSHPPLDDDAYFIQVEWLLEALIAGLRTSNVGSYTMNISGSSLTLLAGHGILSPLSRAGEAPFGIRIDAVISDMLA